VQAARSAGSIQCRQLQLVLLGAVGGWQVEEKKEGMELGFVNELEIISRASHKNLAQCLGFCVDRDTQCLCLVLKFSLPIGSVASRTQGKNPPTPTLCHGEPHAVPLPRPQVLLQRIRGLKNPRYARSPPCAPCLAYDPSSGPCLAQIPSSALSLACALLCHWELHAVPCSVAFSVYVSILTCTCPCTLDTPCIAGKEGDPLYWAVRKTIAKGAADGVAHLHGAACP